MDPNEDAFKEAIKNADLPKFPDLDEVNTTLESAARANIHHTWRQRGPFLVCTSCPHEHSQWIGVDKHLTDIDKDGNPVISPTGGAASTASPIGDITP